MQRSTPANDWFDFERFDKKDFEIDWLNYYPNDILDMIKNRSSHNFNTNVTFIDNILTLSTCYNNNEKMVVHAKLIKKESK